MEDKIIEYFEGKMSPTESANLLRLVDSDKELKKLFIRIQNTYTLLNFIPEKKDDRQGKAGYGRFKQITRRKTIHRALLQTTAYAATVALLVIGTWYVASSLARKPITMTEVYAPAGQRSRLTLNDGSVVWLNSRSTLAYPSNFSDDRHVVLTGEAFFEVTANSDRPFTVTMQNVNITALGTKFNVNGYPENDGIQASLIDGSIKICDHMEQELTLQPDQQALYRNGVLTLEPIEHTDYFLWTKGIYSFVNEPLSNIIKKLERYYDVKIEVEDLSILDYEYTVKFRQQDGVDMLLRFIQKIHPFKFERKDDLIILKK